MTPEQARKANREARFLPPDPRDDNDRPGIALGDVMVIAHYSDDGVLRISLHFDGEEPTPVSVTMENGTVLEVDRDGATSTGPFPSSPTFEGEFRHHTPTERVGIRTISGMSDDDVLLAARDRHSSPFRYVYDRMGGNATPIWITVHAAHEALRRGLMNPAEVDGILGS